MAPGWLPQWLMMKISMLLMDTSHSILMVKICKIPECMNILNLETIIEIAYTRHTFFLFLKYDLCGMRGTGCNLLEVYPFSIGNNLSAWYQTTIFFRGLCFNCMERALLEEAIPFLKMKKHHNDWTFIFLSWAIWKYKLVNCTTTRESWWCCIFSLNTDFSLC